MFKKIILLVVGICTIIGCKSDAEKSKKTQNQIEETSTQEEQNTVFHKTLTFQTISFEIKTTGEGSISQLSIQPKGLEIDNRSIEMELDGQVLSAEIEDLNADGFPEILIYTVSAGSGSYGDVIGYSVNNGKSISQIFFPKIAENKEASKGYMGHDEFTIVANNLVQKFPVYKNGDPNSNPTGGTRQIHYKLIDGEASRLFVIDKISTD